MKKIILFSTLFLSAFLFAQEMDPSITPLMHAVVANDISTVSKLINKESVNQQDNKGLTPLMYAALNNYSEIVQLLLDNGAKINMVDKMAGSTALIWASTADSVKAAKVLVSNKADKNIKDIHDKTALDYARSEMKTC